MKDVATRLCCSLLLAAGACAAGEPAASAQKNLPPANVVVFENEFEPGSPSQGLSPLGMRFFYKLYASQESRTLIGHQASTIAGVGWRHWEYPNDRSDFHDVSGRYPALYGWELESRIGDSNQTLDYIGYDLTTEEIDHARNRGGINSFVIHMRRLDNPPALANPDRGAWHVSPAGLCARLVPNGDLNGAYQAKLNTYASYLRGLQHNGQPMPFLLRPFHEADGGWFWWGTVGCNHAEFKALFRYTVQYLRNAGLGHMLVVYAPGTFNTRAEYLVRYPGDDVVDVIAMDQYLRGTDPNHGTTAADLTNKLSIVHALAQERGKIAAWAEAGQKQITSQNAFSQMRQIVQNSGAKLAYMMFWANYEPAQFYVPHAGSSQNLKNDFNQFLTPPMVTAGQYPSLYP